jgi:1,4-alpha-glucan branching enzyme
MRRNKKHKTNGNGSSQQPVRLRFTSPTARSVSVAGTFNDWRPGATPMVPLGSGRWVKELVLAPGTYEYRLVVDDAWIADPLGLETVANPLGGMNSVLKVSQTPETNNGGSGSHSPK